MRKTTFAKTENLYVKVEKCNDRIVGYEYLTWNIDGASNREDYMELDVVGTIDDNTVALSVEYIYDTDVCGFTFFRRPKAFVNDEDDHMKEGAVDLGDFTPSYRFKTLVYFKEKMPSYNDEEGAPIPEGF